MSEELPDGQETQNLLLQVENGDDSALEQLLSRHRTLVRRMVELRMDPKMRGRVDASDIVQEAQMEVAKRITDYLQRRPMPFHLWLRQTAYQNLLRLRRHHVEAQCRGVENEIALRDHSSILLAQQLMGPANPPDKRLLEQELVQRVHEALAELDDLDREIILMRNFEGMDNKEIAQVLELDPKAASKRVRPGAVKTPPELDNGRRPGLSRQLDTGIRMARQTSILPQQSRHRKQWLLPIADGCQTAVRSVPSTHLLNDGLIGRIRKCKEQPMAFSRFKIRPERAALNDRSNNHPDRMDGAFPSEVEAGAGLVANEQRTPAASTYCPPANT